jgi:hypothetical protein
MLLKEAFQETYTGHWKCPGRRHLQKDIQGTGNALEKGIYNNTYRA